MVFQCRVVQGKVILSDKDLYDENESRQIMIMTLFQYVYGAISKENVAILDEKYEKYKEIRLKDGLVPEYYYIWMLKQLDINILIK